MSQFTYKEAYGRNLPHIQPPAATLFVTFRLAGSIPSSVMDEWLREKREITAAQSRRAALGQPAETGDQLAFQRRWFRKFESLLHAGETGPLWLGEPRIAELVREALHLPGRQSLSPGCFLYNAESRSHCVRSDVVGKAGARNGD